MKVLFLILVSSVAASSQSSKDLGRTYGAPTSVSYEEKYLARPYNKETGLSVSVTAHFTKDRLGLCWMRVEVFPYPIDPDFQITAQERTRRDDLIQTVIDEVLPVKDRGKNIINGFLSGACSADGCGGSWEKWEKVYIFNSGNSHRYADLTFKDRACN